MISGGFKNMNADQIIKCILAAMLKLEKSVNNYLKDKLDKGGYAGTAQTLSDAINAIPIPTTKSEFNTQLSDGDFLFVGDITIYTDEQAQDAVGGILIDSSTIDITYDDITPSIAASVKPNSITATELSDNINLTEFVNNAGYMTTVDLPNTKAEYNSSLTDGNFLFEGDVTGGVQSVTGASVDNTDVSNPVLRYYIKSNENLSLALRKNDTLYGILDQYTGENVILYKISGTPTVDNIIYFNIGSEYFKRNYDKINIKWFGAKGDGVTDDTSSIQAAINASYSDGGSVVYFPNEIYAISGPLITSLNGVNPNCQLYVPLTDVTNIGISPVIKLVGETPPNFNATGLTTWDKNYKGVVLLSTVTGSGTNPSVFGSSWATSIFGDWNYTQLYLEGITIRTKSKSGGTHIAPTVGGINAGKIELFSAINVHIDTESENFNSVVPSVDVTGIITPYEMNNAWSYLNRVMVEGFNKGIRVSEHTNGTNVAIFCCVEGLHMESSGHLSSFDHLVIQWCNYNIYVPNSLANAPTLKINNFAIESYNNSYGVRWYSAINDIYDLQNQLRGEAKYLKILSLSGIVLTLSVTGAKNFNKYNLYRQGEKLTVLGSNLNVTATGTGLTPFTDIAVLEINSNTPSSIDEGFSNLYLTHTQNGNNNLVGRISFINIASTIPDKRIAQIYATTDGNKEAGKMYVTINNGTSMQSVVEIEGEKVVLQKPLRLKSYTVATLPTGTQGDTAYVTDALTPTYLGTLIGGGSVKCPVFYNGSNWVSTINTTNVKINNTLSKSTDYTVLLSDYVNNNVLVIYADATAGNFTITLPNASVFANYEIIVKKIDSSANSVTITGNANIDGASTLIVSSQYSKSKVTSNGTQYFIL